MIPPGEIARIHAALTRTSGNRAEAAQILGIPQEALRAAVSETPDLAALWVGKAGKGRDLGSEEAYDRDRPVMPEALDAAVDLALPEGVTPRDAGISEAFHQQDAKLQKFDWEGLGVRDDKTLSIMRQFEQGVGRGVLRMMDAMQGGMAFCFARVSRQFVDVTEALEKEMELPKHDDAKIAFLHARFMDLAKLMQTFNKEANNAAHTRLLIADRAKKIQQAGNRMKKPGWNRVKSIPVKATEVTNGK